MIESKPESSSSFWQSDQLFLKTRASKCLWRQVFQWNFYLCAGMCIILLSPIRGVRRGWHTNTTPTLLRNRSLYKQHHKGERGCCIYEDTVEWRKYNILEPFWNWTEKQSPTEAWQRYNIITRVKEVGQCELVKTQIRENAPTPVPTPPPTISLATRRNKILNTQRDAIETVA